MAPFQGARAGANPATRSRKQILQSMLEAFVFLVKNTSLTPVDKHGITIDKVACLC